METPFTWSENPVSKRSIGDAPASTLSSAHQIQNGSIAVSMAAIKPEPYESSAYGAIRIEAEEAGEAFLESIKTEIFSQPVFPNYSVSVSEELAAQNVQTLSDKVAYQNYLNDDQAYSTSQLVFNHHMYEEQPVEAYHSDVNSDTTAAKRKRWKKYNLPAMHTNETDRTSDSDSCSDSDHDDKDQSPDWCPPNSHPKKSSGKRKAKLNTRRKGSRTNWKHKCSICNKKCRSKQHVKEHEITHTGVKPYKCHICNKGLAAASSLRRHLQTHQDDRPLFHCDKCGKVFKDRKSVTGHRPCNDLNFPCEMCDKSYTRMDLLKAHVRTHTEEKSFICLVCDKAFFTSYLLRRHQVVHAENEGRHHICGKCGKGFKDARSVQTHKPCNFATYCCDHCKKSFTRRDLLKLHMRGHLGLEPFCCPICNKTFTTQSSVKRHLVIHNDQRIIYHCENCGRSFKDRKAFRTHRPCSSAIYTCHVCMRSYTRPDLLKSHMKHHMEFKPFCCEICGKSFISNAQLKRHYTSHSEEKQHVCFKCGASFKTLDSYKTHRPCNTSERMECTLCGNRYVTQAVLRRHMQQVHGLEEKNKMAKPPNKSYSCGMCNKKIKLKLLMQFHSNKHLKDKIFQCLECNECFSKVSERITHTKEKHRVMLPCYRCGTYLQQPGMLKIHLKAHARPYKCVTCYKRFSDLERLVIHRINTHEIDPAKYVHKVIQCYVCGDCFGSQEQLQNHNCLNKLQQRGSSSSQRNHHREDVMPEKMTYQHIENGEQVELKEQNLFVSLGLESFQSLN